MAVKTASLWTIDQLGAQVALVLSVDHQGAPNGRVREIPDLRTIRYYTTLGLLDRPAEMRGRTALYGRRHLLQLVAIKRLQTWGKTLAEIQERLLGLTDAALRRMAQLPSYPEEGTSTIAKPNRAREAGATPRAGSFWTTTPSAPEEGETASSSLDGPE